LNNNLIKLTANQSVEQRPGLIFPPGLGFYKLALVYQKTKKMARIDFDRTCPCL